VKPPAREACRTDAASAAGSAHAAPPTRARVNRARGAVAVAVLTLLAAGCRSTAHRQVNAWWHSSLAANPPPRVILLPLGNETDCPRAEEGMTEELLRAFQQRRLFHVGAAPDQAAGDETLPEPGRQPLTTQQLAAIRRAFGADAVLVGVVSRSQPFPRMQVGLHLRLRDLRNGRLLGQVDEVFDTTNQHTQRRIEGFFDREMGDGTGPLGWQLGTVSPRAFQKFVAWEVAGTLPRRPSRPAGQVRASKNFRKNPRS
jgi:hypothetical protein